MSTCIYKITNPDGKIYIGQAYDFKKRISRYKRLSCERQPKIYNSIKKYGWESHKVEIIHICKKEELNELEQYYILIYNSFDENIGLNLTMGGDSKKPIKKWVPWNKGKKGIYSSETISKIKSARALQVFSEESKAKKLKSFQEAIDRSIVQLSLDGFLIGVYPSQREAGRVTGIDYKYIHNCVVGKTRKTQGYIFL